MWGGPTPIPSSFGSKLVSFFLTSGLPSLDFYRYVYLTRAVQNYVHSFDHRSFQPNLYIRRLLCFALDDHLVVAGEDRHSSRTLVPTLPQEGAYLSKYANRQGAKSAKSPLDNLLALLALPRIGTSKRVSTTARIYPSR